MPGMVTTGNPAGSDYSDRAVVIEVEGLCRQDLMKTSNYKVKVPFSRMNEAYQSIGRTGGKIAAVYVANATPTSAG